VAHKPDAELGSALDRLIHAGLLFRQGAPPHASYLFKHALVQDAAYGTLLREPRRALHERIAESLESQFVDIAESQPELLARHCTEAGLIEKAAGLWGKAGLRSVERSALVEAVEQLRRALAQIATLPSTPALRSEQIKLQVALVTPLMHIKGYAAPETKAALEHARQLIEQVEALGEPPADLLRLPEYPARCRRRAAFCGQMPIQTMHAPRQRQHYGLVEIYLGAIYQCFDRGRHLDGRLATRANRINARGALGGDGLQIALDA
jgi:hypothetical protein